MRGARLDISCTDRSYRDVGLRGLSLHRGVGLVRIGFTSYLDVISSLSPLELPIRCIEHVGGDLLGAIGFADR